MKIMILINGWTTKISGGDYHILKAARYWSENNQIEYLLPRLGCQYSRDFISGKYRVYNNFFEKEVKNILEVIVLYSIRLLQILIHPLRGDYHILLASSHFLIDVLPALYLQVFNPHCKLVAYYHGLQVKGTRKLSARRINDYLSIRLLKKFNLIFTVNQETKDYLIRKGVKERNIKLTSNGVDLDKISNYTQEHPEKIYEACFLGRLTSTKGILDLPEIWKKINKKKDHKLVVIGDGPDKQELINKIDELDLNDNILVTGHLNDAQKYSYMVKSRIFLFPSYSESWGTAIAEALACGLPAVAYDLNIYHEIFPDQILTVKKGDIKGLADQITQILDNEKLIVEKGKLGREFVEKFNFQRVAQKELSAINELI